MQIFLTHVRNLQSYTISRLLESCYFCTSMGKLITLGVGLYIKYLIEYKVRQDLDKIDESINHLWIECKGNNCNKSYLVAGLYQPYSYEKEKWIEKLDTLLSIVNIT